MHSVRAACDNLSDRHGHNALDELGNLWRELGATRNPNVNELPLPPVSTRQSICHAPCQAHHHQLSLARHNVRSSTLQVHAPRAGIDSFHRSIAVTNEIDLATNELFKRLFRG